MRFVVGLLFFAVAIVLSLATSLWGILVSFGRDIGPAGGAVWFVMVPAALIGTALAYPISRHFSLGDDISRRAVFLVAAAGLSFLLGGLPGQAYKSYERANREPPPPEQFAYVRASDFVTYVRLNVSEYVTIGEPAPIRIERHAGPWQKVHADRLESGVEHFDTQPLASDPRLTGEPALEADPPGCMRLASMDPASGEGRAVFSKTDWGCKVWATMKVPSAKDQVSNVVTVTALRKQ